MDFCVDALKQAAARLCVAAAAMAPAVAWALATAAPAATPPSPVTTHAAGEPSVVLGRRAYTSYCARCHGLNLVVSSSAFYDLRTFPRADKERFLRSVRQGTRAMPAWEGIVKPEEMESIWLFVGSVNGW